VRYTDGTTVNLGDVVNVPVPTGSAKARVVMLGATYEHLELEPGFLAWVKEEKVLGQDSVVVEWMGSNPLAHDDPRFAPVGNYMFSPIDEHITRDA
jgi:hypothetical protein